MGPIGGERELKVRPDANTLARTSLVIFFFKKKKFRGWEVDEGCGGSGDGLSDGVTDNGGNKGSIRWEMDPFSMPYSFGVGGRVRSDDKCQHATALP